MRKGLFLTLLCVPLLGVAQMINTPASRQEKKLVGEVKSYTERVYDVFNGNVQQKRLSTTNGYDFDDSGKVLMNFMQYGEIELRYEYSYNDLGKMLEVKTFRGRNGVELYEKGVYEYDDKGRMMKYSVLVTGVATPVQTYVFSKWDAAGNAVEGELTTSRDKVKVYQEFDKEGRRTLLRMDLNVILEEGNELFTYISFDIDENSPVCVEHLFSIVESGKIQVDYDSESFAGFYELEGIKKPKENTTLRNRGTMTIRNDGKGVGRLYIYRQNRVLTPNHTTVGQVVYGMALIDCARENEYITVKSEQQRLLLLNHSQAGAEALLNAAGVEQIREGVVADDALIVEQSPKHTIDILREGKVVTKAINKEDLCEIKFTENAPRSVKYFKFLSGLLENPIGSIKVHFSVPGMHILIFEGDKKLAKGLIPENNPTDIVPACTIGITNMASKSAGLIGVRFEDNKEFGPTAESFNATNMVGKIVSDPKRLEKIKEGVVVYVTESMY